MKLACQEHLIPAATLSEKWKLVESLGYDGIELRGEANFALRDRLPELRAARRGGRRGGAQGRAGGAGLARGPGRPPRPERAVESLRGPYDQPPGSGG